MKKVTILLLALSAIFSAQAQRPRTLEDSLGHVEYSLKIFDLLIGDLYRELHNEQQGNMKSEKTYEYYALLEFRNKFLIDSLRREVFRMCELMQFNTDMSNYYIHQYDSLEKRVKQLEGYQGIAPDGWMQQWHWGDDRSISELINTALLPTYSDTLRIWQSDTLMTTRPRLAKKKKAK